MRILSSKLAIAIVPFLGGLLLAQTPGPTFDVASIKPNKDVAMRQSGIRREHGGAFSGINVSLGSLIGFAYDVRDYEITGGASWIDNERWDIVAKPSAEAAAAESAAFDDASTVRLKARVRALLADRFQLLLRRETKELPAYELKVGKDGHKMTAAANDANTQMLGNPGGIEAKGVTMKTFADNMLSRTLGRRVVDETGLTGKFDFLLKLNPEPTGAPPEAEPSATDLAAAAMIDAVREQLGLRLEPHRLRVEVLVIDRAERPAAN